MIAPERPHAGLALALLALALCGTVALWLPASLADRSERNWKYFLGRQLLQAGFDSLSVACGVGLLTRDISKDYSPAGRWTLWTLGHFGALLYLAAATRLLSRLRSPDAPGPPASVRLALLTFLVTEAVLMLVVWAADRLAGPGLGPGRVAWLVGGAFASLGILERPADAWTSAVLTLTSLIAGLGWPVWLCVVPALARRVIRIGSVLRLAAGYAAFLLGAALLLWVLEAPRGVLRAPPTQESLSLAPPGVRFLRCLTLSICASSAGTATEDLTAGAMRDASRGLLAAVVLIGPLGGSAGGGIKWLLFVSAIAAIVGYERQTPDGPRARRDAAASAGRFCLVAMGGATALVAIGLLLIEMLTATGFQPAPSLGDALLDACAALGGAGLSSGLAATVTSPSLTRGLGLSVDLYPIGMAWLMLAMLAGRVLPLWLLVRWSRKHDGRRFADTPLL